MLLFQTAAKHFSDRAHNSAQVKTGFMTLDFNFANSTVNLVIIFGRVVDLNGLNAKQVDENELENN